MYSSLRQSFVRVRASQILCNHRLRWMSTSRSTKKTTHCQRALDHFDDFYSRVYGDRWPSIRLGLLCSSKKCAIVNNYGDKERVVNFFQSEGAQNIRKVFEEKKQSTHDRDDLKTASSSNIYKSGDELKEILLERQRAEIGSFYPEPVDSEKVTGVSEQLKSKEVSLKSEDDYEDAGVSTKVSDDPTIHTPLSASLKDAELDRSRLLTPSAGAMIGASLYEFIPATKLKGMEDYVTESSHYGSFNTPSDFPLDIENENNIDFPEELDIYAFERGNCLEFPPPGESSTGVIDYQECSLGMLAPFLALDLEQGDRVLDVNSSQDSLALLSQAVIVESLVANSSPLFKASRMKNFLSNIFFDFEDFSHITVLPAHPLTIEGSYDKILVNAPCTDDRYVTHYEEGNIFNPSRSKERLTLPETQADILCRALMLVEEGGTVVYCTRTLSPIQNDGVVHMALRKIWQDRHCKFVVRDLTRVFEPLQPFMELVPSVRYGHMVLPFLPNNCGPIYFCKLVKVDQESDDSELSEDEDFMK